MTLKRCHEKEADLRVVARTGRKFAALLCMTACGAALCTLPRASVAKISLPTAVEPNEAVHLQFDSQYRQTYVTGHVASDACFSFALPQEWRSRASGSEIHLKSTTSDVELTIGLRPAHELQGLSQSDPASRDAALLQQDYEALLGRPAQSVSLASLSDETTWWSATWMDANLPSGSLMVEIFITPLSKDWLLELSFSNVRAKEEHDMLVRSLLGGLKVPSGQGCHGFRDQE